MRRGQVQREVDDRWRDEEGRGAGVGWEEVEG